MTLALIPARAGSKGIKNKNLAMLGGHPLLFYSVEAAKRAKGIDKIVVSTDGEAIGDYARSIGAEVLRRPSALAMDNTLSQDVVSHALLAYECDVLVLLQPTSPFRSSMDIDAALRIFEGREATALLSVVPCDNKLLKAFLVGDDGCLKGVCNNEFPFMPRQALPPTYHGNGAIYIVRRDEFLMAPSFCPPGTAFYVMDSMSSLDIDGEEDLQRAREILDSGAFSFR